ncbi:MAG: nucleotidyl transferase AbiEii/AbiGii toxin family protein [Gammaproteobacteria bacterium]|nr:nucleotidyl transferase AbiEii/AbiGii toxin family protein [Gammaproteobacteria bacterium]
MNEALEFMLQRYDCKSRKDYENALKEIIQEIALLGLWRSKFFEKAAFYGGTALRILYGLDRFSEDLDFSLLSKDPNFSLDEYLKAIQMELQGIGFEVTIETKNKEYATGIKSAFIKAGTKTNLLKIKMPFEINNIIHRDELLKIKLEVDVNPPGGFQTEAKILLVPIPFSVNTYVPSDLFAGKMHAILCRPWKNRIKGRHWYDLVWYIAREIPVNLQHLEKRLQQTNHWQKNKKLTHDELVSMIEEKIAKIDFNQAKDDVVPFLKNTDSVRLWSNDFFIQLIDKLKSRP